MHIDAWYIRVQLRKTQTCRRRKTKIISDFPLKLSVLVSGGSSSWKGGGAQIVDREGEFQGAGPLVGVQGAEPPGVGKFCISELNSRDLVHTFCQHYIENLFPIKRYSSPTFFFFFSFLFFSFFLFFFLNYGIIGLYENGSFILLTLVSSSPSYSPFRSIWLFLAGIRFSKQITLYTWKLEFQLWVLTQKRGSRGQKLVLFSG